MEKITRELILNFIAENDVEYSSTHAKLCIPIIDRIYRKMIVGIRFTEIKVDGEFVCDGHHRYLASLLANYTLGSVPSVRTSAIKIVNWELVNFDEEDWDTPAKIRMLNEQDADYNGIPIEELIKLLK